MAFVLFPVIQFTDDNGAALASGDVLTYVGGTTTPAATYSNSTGTAAANPVPLDASGRPNNGTGLWLDSTVTYKFIIRDSNDNELQTIDNYAPSGGDLSQLATNVSFVTLGTTSLLASERVLTAGSGITLTDAGAGSTLTAAVSITGLTEDTSPDITADFVATYDTSATANKKVKPINILNINGLTADATPDGAADYVLSYDASATTAKKVLINNFPLNVSGLTADAAPVGSTDYVLEYDASAAANKKLLIDNIPISSVNNVATDGSPVGSTDYVLSYDASATANKKVLMNNLPVDINGKTNDATPDGTADYVMSYDASASSNKKILLNNLPIAPITNLTADASPDVTADYVATYDASASTNKKVLLNLLPQSNIVVNTQTGSTYTVVAGDLGKLVNTTTAATVTVSLTAAATLGSGFWCYVQASNSTSCTIDPNGAEGINGETTLALNCSGIIPPLVFLWCTGTAWIAYILPAVGFNSSVSNSMCIPHRHIVVGSTSYSQSPSFVTFSTTKAQITSNQNDYSIASGFGRISSDAARNITGIVSASAQLSGSVMTLVNVGAFTITLKHEDAASTAANRMTLPGAVDYSLLAEGAISLVYDAISTRWRKLV